MDMWFVSLCIGVVVVAVVMAPSVSAADHPLAPPPLGGVNAAPVQPPPDLVLDVGELAVSEHVTIRVPTGSYTAPDGGAPLYSVPGPIIAFRAGDGVWRGHGYLETYPRLLTFEGTLTATGAELDYRFEDDARYQVTLTVRDGVVLVHERSALGPRNLWVFDAGYGWQASAAIVTDRLGQALNYRYLPCHYDRTDVTIQGQALAVELAGTVAEDADQQAAPEPAGVALIDAQPSTSDLLGVWVRDVAAWESPDQMAWQVWQHRQRAGDPASRHFLGPESKSDGTPNPRTAALLGQSPWEPHVTIEFNLGHGSRHMVFAAWQRPDALSGLGTGLQRRVAATQEGN